MVIPTFDQWAPAPDLAGAYLGGVAASQRGQQIANESAQAGAALQIQQQRLQQESEQAAMLAQIKQQQLQEEHLKSQQELAIKSQYEQQLNDLKRDQLTQAGQLIQAKTQEAAQKYAAQQQYRARIGAGEDPQQVMREMAPLLGMTSASMASLFHPTPPALGSKITGPDGMNLVVTGTNQAQPYVPAGVQEQPQEGNPDSEGEDQGVPETATGSGAQIPTAMTPAMIQASTAGRSVAQRGAQAAAALAQRKLEADAKQARQDKVDLLKEQEDDILGEKAVADRLKGKKLTNEQEVYARAYQERARHIAILNSKLFQKASGGEVGNSQPGNELGDGEAIHTLKNGRKAVFKDREFIRYAD
jgi:hypothetical protein